ncbi:Glycosyl transferase family 2 [Aeromonas sp. RU39B]|uniref:glycosyltransferase n=1 Tax=Aeromonas sp. RU39B TaxID=1907416 RepID=UPI0009556176|nr:glycosyltransferase [Aeromonas sp. RU39B]SIQ14088.1 Glycosyl transferase family 2 [Aeromonas sp. RU39B]
MSDIRHEIKISALLSVYLNSDAHEFEQALSSLSEALSPPEQIVIVVDGPVSDAIEKVLANHEHGLDIVRLGNNHGLGMALNMGIEYCKYPWIARFDSDDICAVSRFVLQREYIKNNPSVDILGGWVDEFVSDVANPYALKKVPSLPADIHRYSKRRNPFNHMTVVFRKSFIQSIGGYRACYLYEDYDLWMRAMAAGAIVANIPSVLVHARVGNGMIERRGGAKYLLSEQQALYSFFKCGYLTFQEYSLSAMIRFFSRLLPKNARRLFYRHLLR